MTATDDEKSSSAAEMRREILELIQEILDDTVNGREGREQARAAMARTLNDINRDSNAVERFREAVDRRLNPHLYT